MISGDQQDALAIFDELPSTREPFERLERVRKRRYVLIAAIVAAFFTLLEWLIHDRVGGWLPALLGIAVGWALYLRRCYELHDDIILFEERRNREMRELRDAKIRELLETNQKLARMQAKLVSAEKLASIGRLSATLAHEIRNPLTIIQSAAGVIRDDLPEESSSREPVQLIHQEVIRLNGIITDLLNFAKPKPPRLDELQLVDLLRVWLPPLTEELQRKGLRVECVFGADLPMVAVDSDQLYQVLLNVLWNARDALLESGGKCIRLSTTANREKTLVTLDITDDGNGIPEELLRQIGEPFFTTKTQGTGLGIAICMQLMEGMGGRFRISTTPGEGTTVTLTLRTPSAIKENLSLESSPPVTRHTTTHRS